MTNTLKKPAILVGGLVILLVAVVAIALVSLDAIARAAIERGSTYALGVPTTLGSADVGILSGEFTMKDLDVANPEGFDGDYFFQLDEGFVAVSLGSLRQDTVEVTLLALTGVRMNLQKKGGSANYTVITESLKRLESGGTAEEEGDPAEPGKRFMIHEILIKDINVTVDVLPIGGDLTRVEILIEEVRLTEVGSESLTTAEITSRVVRMILAAVVRNGAKLPADLINDLGGALRGLADLGNIDITQIADIADIAGTADKIGKEIETVGKSVDDILKGLGGLLGDKK